MKTVLEAVAPILEKTALTVDQVDALWYPPGDRAMVSVSLQCNTPNPFSVEEWRLFLPSPLQVAAGGDFNSALRQCTVSDGDQLALAFECVLAEASDAKSSDEPILHMKLRDSIDKVFELDLPLDLDDLYTRLYDDAVPSSGASITAILSLAHTEGLVGDPLAMTFAIDAAGLAQVNEPSEKLVYSLCWEESEFLIAGNVSGQLAKGSESGELCCSVVALPRLPGLLSRFPMLKLGYEANGRMMSLSVKTQHPAEFRSLAFLNEAAVASSSKR